MNTSMPDAPHPPRTPRVPVRVLCLRQASFATGPVVVSAPDTLVLFDEDVVVDFGAPAVLESPLHLFHFAALVIGASRVIVDLRGHSLSMSPAFARRQRFFALIALDVTPFPAGTGRFTTAPVRPEDVAVRRGTMGLTSHFGIHSATGGRRLRLEALAFRDFEVGAVALSAWTDVSLRHLQVGSPMAPLTSGRGLMLRDLAERLQERGDEPSLRRAVERLRNAELRSAPRVSDALVRCTVIAPVFNVGQPPRVVTKRIERVEVLYVTFDNITASPRAITALAAPAVGATWPPPGPRARVALAAAQAAQAAVAQAAQAAVEQAAQAVQAAVAQAAQAAQAAAAQAAQAVAAQAAQAVAAVAAQAAQAVVAQAAVAVAPRGPAPLGAAVAAVASAEPSQT